MGRVSWSSRTRRATSLVLTRRRAASAQLSHYRSSAQEERCDRDDEEDDEQNLGDSRGPCRDSRKPEECRDEGDDKKHDGVVEHAERFARLMPSKHIGIASGSRAAEVRVRHA